MKFFFKTAKAKKYEDSIISIHKEENQEKYDELVGTAKAQGYLSLPILMNESGEVIFAGVFDAGKTLEALSKELD